MCHSRFENCATINPTAHKTQEIVGERCISEIVCRGTCKTESKGDGRILGPTAT